MAVYILDTSAVLAVLNQEKGQETVVSLLERAGSNQEILYLPFLALMELEYLLLRRLKPEETLAVLELVKAWPVQMIESDEEWRHQAAMVKAVTPLSVVDAWIASLALLFEAEIVHKDPEYEQVPDLRMLKLPY